MFICFVSVYFHFMYYRRLQSVSLYDDGSIIPYMSTTIWFVSIIKGLSLYWSDSHSYLMYYSVRYISYLGLYSCFVRLCKVYVGVLKSEIIVSVYAYVYI